MDIRDLNRIRELNERAADRRLKALENIAWELHDLVLDFEADNDRRQQVDLERAAWERERAEDMNSQR
jgi:hypothetical protein